MDLPTWLQLARVSKGTCAGEHGDLVRWIFRLERAMCRSACRLSRAGLVDMPQQFLVMGAALHGWRRVISIGWRRGRMPMPQDEGLLGDAALYVAIRHNAGVDVDAAAHAVRARHDNVVFDRCVAMLLNILGETSVL